MYSFLMDPWTYNYYNSHWSDGYSSNVNAYKGEHTTDVTQKKALAMLDDAASSGDQFFMMVAPGTLGFIELLLTNADIVQSLRIWS